MPVVYPDVVLISSDDEDESNFLMTAVNHEIVLISSDDEDDIERNVEEGVASEQEAEYIDLVDLESDYDEQDNDDAVVEKLNVDNCDRSGGNNLHVLSLPECKKYLREHGVRVSGTKEECIQRIEEFNRLKDGTGESCYPKSSFSINCTGDACRGDVVLFKQNMYNNQRHLIGRRTVAGRIVNESYSASTQHIFLVEVLWSKRCKKLDPLSILPVKGRNLYQFGTFRQPWKSEAERSIVLKEKHERGKAARLKWRLREKESIFGDNKGKKLPKVSHRVSSHSKRKHVNKNTTTHNQALLFQNLDLKRPTQLTYHSDPNCSMHSDHHLEEASLPFPNDRTLQFNSLPHCRSSGHSHHNNEQQVPDQGLYQDSQPPDQHHDSESPVQRSKEDNVKFLFPESSFSINCTGDARERDVVLFKQEVFSGGKNVKKRTIAGRIFKVRQRKSGGHSFRIKVLWTVPSMNNHRRFTLLVRSRNLYKFGTYRQPWKDETMRSEMFEEKHGPATRKRKLKKTDIASNENKCTKRRKVSHNGPSPSNQPTQNAKQNSSNRKDARATRVKGTKIDSKKKSVQLQKKKAKKSKQQTIQPHPNPNTNLDPSLCTNLNQNSNSNPIPTTTLKPNPSLDLNTNPNAHQNQNLNTHENQNPNSTDPNLVTNSNPIPSTTLNLSPSPHLISNQHTNPNTHQIQKRKTLQNQKQKIRQKQKPKTCQNQKPKIRQNQKPKTHQYQNPNNTDPNLKTNLNPVSSTTLNSSPNPHLNPNQHNNNQQPSPVYPTYSKATKTRARAPALKPNQHKSPKSKPNKNPCPNSRRNPNPNPHQNPNPNPRQNPNPNSCQNPNPNLHQNPNPANPHPNTSQNLHPNTRQNLHLNTCQNLNPHLNNYMPANQLQGSSLPIPNEPLVWIPPNQTPFGFPGYGGQWGPNHILTQPPVYDYMAALMLVALCYQQQ